MADSGSMLSATPLSSSPLSSHRSLQQSVKDAPTHLASGTASRRCHDDHHKSPCGGTELDLNGVTPRVRAPALDLRAAAAAPPTRGCGLQRVDARPGGGETAALLASAALGAAPPGVWRAEPCEASPQEAWPLGATTVAVQNVPARTTQEEILRIFEPDGNCNMLYLPYSIKHRRTCGYCFLNFLTPDTAQQFCERWDGCCLHGDEAAEKCPRPLSV